MHCIRVIGPEEYNQVLQLPKRSIEYSFGATVCGGESAELQGLSKKRPEEVHDACVNRYTSCCLSVLSVIRTIQETLPEDSHMIRSTLISCQQRTYAFRPGQKLAKLPLGDGNAEYTSVGIICGQAV